MKVALYYGKPGELQFKELVQQLPASELKKLSRSTIPLLSYWRLKNPKRILCRILKKLEIENASEENLYVEYSVSPSQGAGKVSVLI
jgi:hypothetical protein